MLYVSTLLWTCGWSELWQTLQHLGQSSSDHSVVKDVFKDGLHHFQPAASHPSWGGAEPCRVHRSDSYPTSERLLALLAAGRMRAHSTSLWYCISVCVTLSGNGYRRDTKLPQSSHLIKAGAENQSGVDAKHSDRCQHAALSLLFLLFSSHELICAHNAHTRVYLLLSHIISFHDPHEALSGRDRHDSKTSPPFLQTVLCVMCSVKLLSHCIAMQLDEWAVLSSFFCLETLWHDSSRD